MEALLLLTFSSPAILRILQCSHCAFTGGLLFSCIPLPVNICIIDLLCFWEEAGII